jgi:hypothetical protein
VLGRVGVGHDPSSIPQVLRMIKDVSYARFEQRQEGGTVEACLFGISPCQLRIGVRVVRIVEVRHESG